MLNHYKKNGAADLSISKKSSKEDMSIASAVAVYQQSWAYIRHAQEMFWKTFTAILSIIAAIFLYSLTSGHYVVVVGTLFCFVFSMVGFFVSCRVIRVIREHFVVVNRARSHCGIDELEIVPDRWKSYSMDGFHVFRPETIYIAIVNWMYGAFMSVFGSFFVLSLFYPVNEAFDLSLLPVTAWVAVAFFFVLISGMCTLYAKREVYAVGD